MAVVGFGVGSHCGCCLSVERWFGLATSGLDVAGLVSGVLLGVCWGCVEGVGQVAFDPADRVFAGPGVDVGVGEHLVAVGCDRRGGRLSIVRPRRMPSAAVSAMVVTFLGWWAWTASFFCLLATEIPTGTRAAGGQGPGARLFSEKAAASECGMKNLASHQAKRSAAAALPAAGRRSKSKGQKTKAVRWCIKSCLTSVGVAARGFLFHPRPRRTPHLLPLHRHWLRHPP